MSKIEVGNGERFIGDERRGKDREYKGLQECRYDANE